MKDIEIACCTWEINDVTPGRRVRITTDAPGAKSGDELMIIFRKSGGFGEPADTWGLVFPNIGMIEMITREQHTVLSYLNRYKAIPVNFQCIEFPKDGK